MAKRILIIDDSESIRETIAFTLESEGFEVDKAMDGQDALKQISETPTYDLVITDLHMPEMDGLEFIKKLRSLDNYMYVPIIFLTTESQTSMKMEAKNAGATGWIVKPFVPDKLISALNKVMKK